ncbi:histidine kinase [Pseudonocardia sp. ICBG1293]|uniref:histidine kinase n=1 Tax=Pseudonocardia sp. ICBG1293 TaxID=2844382 RepID=UPI001CCE83E0|nr:histidine kinase [Pseudonocardia sp. ICBG1293]
MPTAERAVAAPVPAPLPGTRAGDVALTVLTLLLVGQEFVTGLLLDIPGVAGRLDPVASVVLAVVLCAALTATVLVRRQRPRRAYLVMAALAAVSLGSIGGFAALLWPLLAFSVARAPQRGAAGAAAWVALPFLAAVGAAAVPRMLSAPDPAYEAGLIVGGSAVVLPLLVVATVAGRWSRAAALRADRERAETERLRRGAALDAERSRIAEEIGGGVLSGLRGLVDRAAALGPDAAEAELRAVRDRARAVLAAMRRVLGVLRAAPAGSGTATDALSPTGTAPAGTAPAGSAAGGTAPTGTAHESPAHESPAHSGTAPTRTVHEGTAHVGPRRPGPGSRLRAVAHHGRVPLPDRAGVWGLVAFVVPAVLFAVAFAPLTRTPTGWPTVDGFLALVALPLHDPAAAVVVGLQFAVIAWWRTAPLPALLVSGACSFAAGLLGGANLFAESGWVLLVWGAATTAPVVASAVTVLVSTLVVLTGGMLTGVWERLGSPPSVVALNFVAVVPLWAAGVAVRRHRLDTDLRRRDLAEAAVRDDLVRERLRVARDLHDVVAHHVSAVAVQAGAARLAADAQARADALGHIADSARRVAEAIPALADLAPDPATAALTPAGLDALVAPSRAAGLPVGVVVTGTPADPPGEAELFASRIVTEALTNTLRHAGPSPTRVRVAHGGERGPVVVEVVDDGPVPGHRPDGTGSGLGLVGMAERVALLGGDLHTGPGDGPGWTVRAVLPRATLVRADDPAAAPISSCAPIRGAAPGS